MKNYFLFSVLFAQIFLTCLTGQAEEMYIISTSDGDRITVKDYHFTDERVEFTTENGLPGFIKKENFVSISNTEGVAPGPDDTEPIEVIKQREMRAWAIGASFLLVAYLFYLVRVIRKKEK